MSEHRAAVAGATVARCARLVGNGRYLPARPEPGADHAARLAASWSEIEHALHRVGFVDAEKDDIVANLAGILHLGDIEFAAEEGGGSAVSQQTRRALLAAADALLLDDVELARAFCTGQIITRGETITTQYPPEKAADTRNGASMAIFDRLFAWLVKRIDAVLTVDPHAGASPGAGSADPVSKAGSKRTSSRKGSAQVGLGGALTVGILDIFGFEEFEKNGFDQFCINLANERLQAYFTHHIFAAELAEYKRDGLDSAAYAGIQVPETAMALDIMFARHGGFISVLNETCKFQTSGPGTLVSNLNRALADRDAFVVSKQPDQFGVVHYAGTVVYAAEGFIEKNRDVLPALVVQQLAQSGNPLLQLLFAEESSGAAPAAGAATKKSQHGAKKSEHGNKSKRGFFSARFTKKSGRGPQRKKAKATTVATSFVASLKQLMAKMEAAQPHFVRCIKPNKQ